MEYAAMLEKIREFALGAGDWVRTQRPTGRVDVAATKSSPTDVVTALDRGCEDRLRSQILRWRPNDAFLGEEGQSVSGTSGLEWIVDPIDGTVNFMYGIGGYAISIGARVQGEIVLGYILNIATGEEFGAIRGQGAWRWTAEGRQPMLGPPRVTISESLVATGFNYTQDLREKQGQAVAKLLPHVRDIRRCGSAALDLAALADGRLDAYVEEGLKPWDLAAGALMCEEVGLTVTGLDGPASERLVLVSRTDVSRDFLSLVRRCGF